MWTVIYKVSQSAVDKPNMEGIVFGPKETMSSQGMYLGKVQKEGPRESNGLDLL